MTPAEAAEAMQDGAVLLDVREPFEVATAHIDGAIPIPMGEVIGRIDELPSDRTVLCLCHHGGRSAQVAAYLAGQGFDVANVTGGTDQWSISHDPDVPRYT
ncbi:rhodanese-like domain-containing protein [soil metagenome]